MQRNTRESFRRYLIVCALVVAWRPAVLWAGTATNATQAGVPRDGQHDFDFAIGTWKTHIRRLQHPLSGSTTWLDYDGAFYVSKVWDGRAILGETEADGPAGHLEGMVLRLYDPQTHEWNLSYANSAGGVLSVPSVGKFQNGRGEFYDAEPINGKYVLVRQVWSDITPNSCQFEQAFSDDGGRTWEVNFSAIDTRVSDDEANAQAKAAKSTSPAQLAENDGQRDFDFEIGSWKVHLRKLQKPMAGSTAWGESDGTVVARKIWNGRANLEEFESQGAGGHIEGLALRLFDPQSHQWRIYWASSKDGIVGQPMVGEFKNGRGEFYDQEMFDGKAIFVRYIWSDITPNSAHFEQSFSGDGGKTWEANWISDQTRVAQETAKTH